MILSDPWCEFNLSDLHFFFTSLKHCAVYVDKIFLVCIRCKDEPSFQMIIECLWPSNIVQSAILNSPPWLDEDRMGIEEKGDKIYLVFSTLVFLIALSSQMLPVCMTESTGSPCVFECSTFLPFITPHQHQQPLLRHCVMRKYTQVLTCCLYGCWKLD